MKELQCIMDALIASGICSYSLEDKSIRVITKENIKDVAIESILMDSFDEIDFILKLEENYPIDMTHMDLMSKKTLGGLSDYLKSKEK